MTVVEIRLLAAGRCTGPVGRSGDVGRCRAAWHGAFSIVSGDRDGELPAPGMIQLSKPMPAVGQLRDLQVAELIPYLESAPSDHGPSTPG